MKKILLICLAVFCCFQVETFAQISADILAQISKAEDELRFDKTLEDLLKSPNAAIRARAVLASGRSGKESAVPALVNLLETDSDEKVSAAAAFALGEIESTKGADAVLRILKLGETSPEIRARLLEAAGKIAALPAAEKKKAEDLGAAILTALDDEAAKPKPNREIILLGTTAILRARPANGEFIAAKFLTSGDARIRADAANTLSRLRAKNANAALREMLFKDKDAVARANAARALGTAEDKEAFDLLLGTALNDADSRVRVSAIRSLGSLKDAKAADRLLTRADVLFADYKKSKFNNPNEKSELLEIAATLGRILPNSNNGKATKFLNDFRRADDYQSPETEIAFAQIAPAIYIKAVPNTESKGEAWRQMSSVSQGLAEYAKLADKGRSLGFAEQPEEVLAFFLKNAALPTTKAEFVLVVPDLLRAYALFKTADLPEVLSQHLKHKDVIVRATAVELLGELPPEQIRFADFEDSLRTALADEKLNDALLVTIEAVGKQKNERATDFLKQILSMTATRQPQRISTFLARRRTIALLKEKGAGDFSDKLEKPDSIFKPADYVRAVSRKSASAVLTTEKGSFTIEFFPEAAPLTVDNFIKLANAKYFDGLTIHRVVPNFVMQDGDPRGDGNGSPGWEIRDEINTVGFERGTVGMALSGKDTGGSQWFVCHSPQPHLDGGYTVFGRVNEVDMKIVDNLVRGDKILTVKIVENKAVTPTTKDKQKAKTKR